MVQIPLAGTLSDEAEGPLVPAPPPSHTPSFSSCCCCCFRAAPSSCSYYTPLFYCWRGLFFSNTLSRFPAVPDWLGYTSAVAVTAATASICELLFLSLLFLLVFPLLPTLFYYFCWSYGWVYLLLRGIMIPSRSLHILLQLLATTASPTAAPASAYIFYGVSGTC